MVDLHQSYSTSLVSGPRYLQCDSTFKEIMGCKSLDDVSQISHVTSL